MENVIIGTAVTSRSVALGRLPCGCSGGEQSGRKAVQSAPSSCTCLRRIGVKPWRAKLIRVSNSCRRCQDGAGCDTSPWTDVFNTSSTDLAMLTGHLCPLLINMWHGGPASGRLSVLAKSWSLRCADCSVHRRLVSQPSHGSDWTILTSLESSLASPASFGAQWQLGDRTCHCSDGWWVHSRSFLLAPLLHHSGRRFRCVRGKKCDLSHDSQAPDWRRVQEGAATANEGPKECPAASGGSGHSGPVLASDVLGGREAVEGQQLLETEVQVEGTISPPLLAPSLAEDAPADPHVTQSYGHEQRVAGTSSAKMIPWHFSVPAQRTLSKLVPLVQVERGLIVKAWTCTLLSAVCLVQAVPQIGQLSSLLSEGNLRQLLRLSTGLLAIVALRSAAQYFQDTWLWEASLRVTLSLREKTFAHLQTLDMEFFEGRNTTGEGDLAYRVIAESEDAGEMVYSIVQRFVPSVVQLVVVIARMVLLSPSLTVATLAVVPCMGLVIAKLGEQLRGLSRKGQDSVAGLAAYVSEVTLQITGMDAVQILNDVQVCRLLEWMLCRF
ncbi:hypothetical protein CBR_g49225 [Chara braunii]|uniref:ABC transmembrane type-1 domain-containing protein n=1 Tax=Chara braunii TaxID=69332 RepID=A0A388M4B9_CHABU|nr:hypothetical protein CBR_g49225 [Chara braunii]|eukprot:GBG89434.1 hypothetical protein CBR_g49225 [Chara braunii]